MWALCIFQEEILNRIKHELLATNLAPWRKKVIFIGVVLISLFPLFITYKTSTPDLQNNLWQLRHFIGIALIQAVAQISISWYILKNKVPNYVIGCFLVTIILFQATYGISVVLLSHA